ncbi:DUF4124 domain-containing protein [Chromobacterium piscinae]|uniref:DUF4124 domain-containing protein n=1 Tax=Chromobacterium piscinae TaxID=686831 RepID=A0ABV0H0C8_9NEIS|nr:DUF4124 domain-containing protein [Chromobacterium piscinae]MBX9298069.1 DUF4124 domain-containing protein [Chromobacterium vaccinii]MBX9355494.1 DUF4124 domain-containing protein [Chromobacterium vaccinii]MCD4506284.1 DUF4124 domain-containing protein [Chromobacterium piscinae]MCD5326607.1 DUF4124 domain-containing protein [Chromobacterium piscinae]NHQ83843.1 DUF4124 domain-containing protein [Chromobacterium vaccinii]
MKNLLLLGLLLGAELCPAEVFKCRSADGSVAYGQQSCPAGSRALEMESHPFSVIEQNDGGQAAKRYREQLREWADKRDKNQQADAKTEQRERSAQRKKWLAEREHCRRLDAKRAALDAKLRRGQPLQEAERVKLRLAKVEDQMQDRACHLYKEG